MTNAGGILGIFQIINDTQKEFTEELTEEMQHAGEKEADPKLTAESRMKWAGQKNGFMMSRLMVSAYFSRLKTELNKLFAERGTEEEPRNDTH